MENRKPKVLVPKLSLFLRIFVGGYLVYTAYGLVDSIVNRQGKDKLFFLIFTVLFAAIGIFLLFFSVKNLLTGVYIGGKADLSNEESSEENDTADSDMKCEK